jgi:hypothetical protein
LSRSPAGWYDAVTAVGTERYWDGAKWTGETRPSSPQGPDFPESNSGLFAVPNVPEGSEFPEEVVVPPGMDLTDLLIRSSLPPSERVTPEPANRVGWTQTKDRRIRYSRTIMNVAAVTTLLLVVGGAILLVQGRGPSADASVASAAASTMNNRTADVSVSGTFGTGGAGVNVSGTGTVNFTQNAADWQMETSFRGHQLSESAVTVGGTIYLNGSFVSQVVPGKPWIAMNLGQMSQAASASPLLIGDELSTNSSSEILKILGQQGNTVTALGPSTINGTTVQGYSVHLNPDAVADVIARSNLPGWMQRSTSSPGTLDVSYTVFVDSTGLLYRMMVDLALPVHGQNLHGVISMDFSDFGTATTIAAPPADQVAPYQALLQKL